MKFTTEFQLDLGEAKGLEGLVFAQNSNLLFVYSHSIVFVIDLSNNNLIQQINFKELDISLMEEKGQMPWRLEYIEEIVVSADGDLLFVILGGRHLAAIDMKTTEVKNIYSHLQDYRGASFEGAIGLSSIQIDQLRKNGAVI